MRTLLSGPNRCSHETSKFVERSGRTSWFGVNWPYAAKLTPRNAGRFCSSTFQDASRVLAGREYTPAEKRNTLSAFAWYEMPKRGWNSVCEKEPGFVLTSWMAAVSG